MTAFLLPARFVMMLRPALLLAAWTPGWVAAQTAPAPTVTRTLTNGTTSLTVNFTLHPIRSAAFNVQVQDATGAFTSYTADVPRTYLGTVTGRPGALASGYQKANGTFLTQIAFEDGTIWTSSGTAATAGGNANWTPTNFPSSGVGAGGAGSAVRAAELGVDASYREYQAAGATLPGVIDAIEFSVMKANTNFLRDAAILHRIGRIVVRTSQAKCPYDALPHSTTAEWSVLLNKTREEWNTTLPAVLPSSAHDLAVMVKPGIGGGLASVGAIGTASRYSITGASSGDFSQVWRHEGGHNWSSSHFEGGGGLTNGKPEGGTIMSDNNLSRFSSPELARIINHRNSKTAILDNLGAYPFPLPPRVFGDRVTMAAGSFATAVDALVNDSDGNGEALTIASHDNVSALRALILRSPGTGPSGRDQLTYYPPPNFTSGFDYFNYRIQDSAGYQGIGKVYVNPVKLLPLPPLWTSSDIGTVGAAGDAGSDEGNYVVYGAGADIWGTADEFRFVRQTAEGDCDFRARVPGQANTNAYAKAGLMLRQGTAADAAHASLFVTPANGFAFQYRTTAGGASTNFNGPPLNPAPDNWIRLSRIGHLFTAYVSADGLTWTTVSSATIPMPAAIQAGLAVTSHVDASLGGAAFDRMSLRHAEPYARLLQDTFENNATSGNDAADPLDPAWSGGSTLSVVNDPALGSGFVLNADGGTYNGITTGFAGRRLAATGDVLRLSFDFRYTQAPGNSSSGFRFGIYNGAGDGYLVQHGTGGSNAYTLMEDGGADGSFGFGSLSTAASSASGVSLNNQTKHSFSLTISKTGGGVALEASVDGLRLAGTDTTPTLTAFDSCSITNGNITADFRVDNVRVEAIQSAAPQFTADPFTRPAPAIGLAYTGSLTENVTVPHPGYTYAKISGPAWLGIAADGTLSGTPSSGDAGLNAFTVRVTSAEGASDEAVLNLTAAYPVSLVTTDPNAAEEDLSPGGVIFTRTGPTTTAITVNFTRSGTAAAGSDYVSPGTSIVIPAGQSSVTLALTPLDDTLLEPTETIVLTLAAGSGYALGTATTSTISLADEESLFTRLNDNFNNATATPGNDADDPADGNWTNATLTLVADPLFGSGKSLNIDNTGTFGVTRSSFAARSLPGNGDSLKLTLDFRYTAAPTNIAAGLRFGLGNAAGAGFFAHHGTGGSSSYDLIEGPAGSFGSGTYTTLSGTTLTGSKSPLNDQDKHTIVLTLKKVPTGLSVTSTLDGGTLSGIDTTPVITSFDTVVIGNGNQNVDFRIDNVRVEFTPNTAPAFLTDPLVKSAVLNVPLTGSLAADTVDPNPGDTITFQKLSGPAWLSIAANGTLSGTPTAAQSGANEFTVRLTDNYGSAADAPLAVNAGHSLTVSPAAPFARERDSIPGSFLISRGGPVTAALTVQLGYGGTATMGTDYANLPATVVIPAGRPSVSLTVPPLDDSITESDETIILTLQPDAAYAVSTPGSATVTLTDDETTLEPVNDTFDLGTTPTAGNDPDDPTDIAWAGSGSTLAIAPDPTLNTGMALKMTSTGTFAMSRGNFSAIALTDPGDRLKLSLDFRYTETPPSTGSGLRFGLFNSAGDGFLVQQGVGGATGWALAEDTAADGGFGAGSTVSGLTSAARASLNNLTKHTLGLTLVKTTIGLALTGEIDGTALTFTDLTPVITGFDSLVVRHGSLDTDFAIDNVQLELIRNRAPYFLASPINKPDAVPGTAFVEYLDSDTADPNSGDLLTYTKLGGPTWLALAADGTLSGNPAAADSGHNTFSVRVTDPYGLASEATLHIDVGNAPAPIETWRVAQFGEDAGNPVIAGNEADPDQDGLGNLMEYALGLDPLIPASAPAPSYADGILSLTYTRNLAATDIGLLPWWSHNLQTWQATGITLETLGEEGMIRTLKASRAVTSGPWEFLRLRAVLTPP